jgi:ribosome-binding protein aMBF1 (putative translation factor)
MAKLTDQLREAIDSSGMSHYRVSKEIGLDQSTLSRFMSGKAGLALNTVDRLGELLGLKLVVTSKPEKGKGR